MYHTEVCSAGLVCAGVSGHRAEGTIGGGGVRFSDARGGRGSEAAVAARGSEVAGSQVAGSEVEVEVRFSGGGCVMLSAVADALV